MKGIPSSQMPSQQHFLRRMFDIHPRQTTAFIKREQVGLAITVISLSCITVTVTVRTKCQSPTPPHPPLSLSHSLSAASAATSGAMGVVRAGKLFGVPISTLHRKLKGKSKRVHSVCKGMGSLQTALQRNIELDCEQHRSPIQYRHSEGWVGPAGWCSSATSFVGIKNSRSHFRCQGTRLQLSKRKQIL